jgi:hypothetical protein
MPLKLHTTFRYVTHFALNGVNSTHVLSVNGLYDPDITGVGHQPYLFDQLMAIYRRYEVKSSRIEAIVTNRATNSSVALVVYPSIESSPPSTTAYAAELPLARRQIVTADTGGPCRATVRHEVNVSTFIGRTTASVNYTGSASANPSIPVYWMVAAGAVDGVSTTTVDVAIKIDYSVMLYDRYLQAPSIRSKPTVGKSRTPGTTARRTSATAAGSSSERHISLEFDHLEEECGMLETR